MNFLFDVDGTLTPPRLPMSEEFIAEFLQFCRTHKVYLVSGSDYSKLQDQLPEEILKACQAVYSASGNETYMDGEMLHKNIWTPPEELLEILKNLVDTSRTPVKTSKHIEVRNGMINFSTIGRACTHEQRNKYVDWEIRTNERKRLIDTVLAPVFKDLQFSVGGQISIDIYPKGTGKEQVLKDLTGPVAFFGDKTGEGGNDRNIAIATLNIPNSAIFCVDGWEQTKELLKKIA